GAAPRSTGSAPIEQGGTRGCRVPAPNEQGRTPIPGAALFASSRTPGLLDGVLQALPGTERRAGRGANADLLPRARIAPRAGLALAGLEGAEAGDLDLVALLQRRSNDAVARVEQGVDRALRVRLRQLRLARQVLDQLGLVHGLTPLDMKLVTRCADPPPRGTANCGPAGPVPSGPEPGARTCAAPPTTANLSRNGAASIRSIGSDARKVSGTVERDPGSRQEICCAGARNLALSANH